MTEFQSISEKTNKSKEDSFASFGWIFVTFFTAFILNVISGVLDLVWMPDFLALNIIFWTIYRPRNVGMTIAFACGLLMDVQNGSVLGQQALAYITISYLAFILHRRIPWFSSIGQAFHVLPLLLLSQILVMLVRLWFDGLWPGVFWFSQSISGFLCWPIWFSFVRLPHWTNHN